jgi:hypothetical protein
MAKAILTAKVAIVRFGKIEFEGLLFDNRRYGVAVPQLNQLISFSASNNTASRDLKRLLGEQFKASKCKIELTRQLINCIFLEDLEKLLLELAISGNAKAISISRSLIGLSLTQIFSDSFGVVFEQAQRQSYLADRITEIPDKTKSNHFSEDWQKEAGRVTGYQWQGYPMANFIRRWVYDLLGIKVTERLNEVNPYKQGTGRRENLHYQHFDTDADERVLKAHISEILTLLKVSQSEFDFERLMRNRFGDGVQLDLF